MEEVLIYLLIGFIIFDVSFLLFYLVFGSLITLISLTVSFISNLIYGAWHASHFVGTQVVAGLSGFANFLTNPLTPLWMSAGVSLLALGTGLGMAAAALSYFKRDDHTAIFISQLLSLGAAISNIAACGSLLLPLIALFPPLTPLIVAAIPAAVGVSGWTVAGSSAMAIVGLMQSLAQLSYMAGLYPPAYLDTAPRFPIQPERRRARTNRPPKSAKKALREYEREQGKHAKAVGATSAARIPRTRR